MSKEVLITLYGVDLPVFAPLVLCDIEFIVCSNLDSIYPRGND